MNPFAASRGDKTVIHAFCQINLHTFFLYVQAVTYPAMVSMLSKWAPPLERSRMTTFMHAGN